MADKRKAQANAPKLPTVQEWAGKTVVSAIPITTGHQAGKVLLTFADGTKAIFKPAWGEGGRRRRPVGNHT